MNIYESLNKIMAIATATQPSCYCYCCSISSESQHIPFYWEMAGVRCLAPFTGTVHGGNQPSDPVAVVRLLVCTPHDTGTFLGEVRLGKAKRSKHLHKMWPRCPKNDHSHQGVMQIRLHTCQSGGMKVPIGRRLASTPPTSCPLAMFLVQKDAH